MKKISYLAIALLLFSTMSDAQLRFAPEAGVGFNSMRMVPNGLQQVKTNFLFGGKVGGILDLDLTDHTYFQSGIFLSSKGVKDVQSLVLGDTINLRQDETLSLYYLEIPVNVIIKTSMAGKNRFFVGLGVNLSYALSGKDKYTFVGHSPGNKDINTSANQKLVIGADIKGFDIGINTMVGYEFKSGLFLRGTFYYGVNDIGQYDINEKNYGFTLSAGYFIPRKLKRTPEPASSVPY